MKKQNYREEIHVLDLGVNCSLKYLVNVTNKSPRLLIWKCFITDVVLVRLQRPLQCDRQLLVDLMNSRLNFHLDAPLSCFYTILPTEGAQFKKTTTNKLNLKQNQNTTSENW